MAEQNWAAEPSSSPSPGSPGGGDGGQADSLADRTAMIANRLKSIYKKAVLPVEKKYRYDYFYESPFMTDVEFDGKQYKIWYFWLLI